MEFIVYLVRQNNIFPFLGRNPILSQDHPQDNSKLYKRSIIRPPHLRFLDRYFYNICSRVPPLISSFLKGLNSRLLSA